jgi:phytoene dehydrogenase-like protein
MLSSVAPLLAARSAAFRHRRCLVDVVFLPLAIRKAAGDARARSCGAIQLGPSKIDVDLDLNLFAARRRASSTFASSSSSTSSSSHSPPPPPIKDSYDAIVVGGGHNGLVAALLLAREGGENFEVALFDDDNGGGGREGRRRTFGGAARTERPFSPETAARNLKHSTGAYLLGPFPPELLEFCGLGDLPVVKRSPHYFLPESPNSKSSRGGVFFYASDEAATKQSFLSRFSRRDWEAMKKMESELEQIREGFAPGMLCPSPRDAKEAADAFFGSSSSSSSSSSSLSSSFSSLVEGSVADYLDKFEFESETLKAMFCATDGLSGATASPYDAGTGEREIKVFF